MFFEEVQMDDKRKGEIAFAYLELARDRGDFDHIKPSSDLYQHPCCSSTYSVRRWVANLQKQYRARGDAESMYRVDRVAYFLTCFLGGQLPLGESKREIDYNAYYLVKLLASRVSIKINDSLRRRIGNTSQEVDISFDEAVEFTREVLIDLIAETCHQRSTNSLTTG